MTTTTNQIADPIQMPDELVERFGIPEHFHYDMIQALIAWAEQDEDRVQKFMGFVGSWDQGSWGHVDDATVDPDDADKRADLLQEIRNGVCGTSYCMAGQAVVQSGYELIYEMEDQEDGFWMAGASYCAPAIPSGKYDRNGRPVMVPDMAANKETIENKAMEILGITQRESDFFGGENTIDDLKGFANGMCAIRDLPLMYPGHEIRTRL